MLIHGRIVLCGENGQEQLFRKYFIFLFVYFPLRQSYQCVYILAITIPSGRVHTARLAYHRRTVHEITMATDKIYIFGQNQVLSS